MTESGALAGIRVLDVTDDLGAYAARLLADLGASVVRVPRSRDPARDQKEPGFDHFCNAGKALLSIDPDTSEGLESVASLTQKADVLIESSWDGTTLDLPADLNPRLVRVVITPFGREMNPEWSPADDLFVLAAGGLLALGGYQDAGPIAAYGGQSRFAASIYGAVAALAGLIDREDSNRGMILEVSAQECIAQALEDSVPTFALTGRERDRFSETSREAGSGTYACFDGRVSMIAGRLGTARAWAALVAWMNEEGSPGADVLLEPQWSEFEFRQTPEAIARFRTVFERFAMAKPKQELYHEAQRRGIALSPINEVSDVLENPQLAERAFFVKRVDDETGATFTFPGPPYDLSLTPPEVGPLGRNIESSEMIWGLDFGQGLVSPRGVS